MVNLKGFINVYTLIYIDIYQYRVFQSGMNFGAGMGMTSGMSGMGMFGDAESIVSMSSFSYFTCFLQLSIWCLCIYVCTCMLLLLCPFHS